MPGEFAAEGLTRHDETALSVVNEESDWPAQLTGDGDDARTKLGEWRELSAGALADGPPST